MPIPIACPGCGWTETGPDHLKGKKLKCKRCQQSFVVGGGPAATKPSSNCDLNFGDPEMRSAPVRRRSKPRSMTPVIVVFLVCLLVGAGAAAGYLWYTKPAAAADDTSSDKKDKPASFAWISADGAKKSKDAMDLPFDDKDLKDLKPMGK